MEQSKREFIAETLANNEHSSDKELVEFFIKEIDIDREEAVFYVGQRQKFLVNTMPTVDDLGEYEVGKSCPLCGTTNIRDDFDFPETMAVCDTCGCDFIKSDAEVIFNPKDFNE